MSDIAQCGTFEVTLGQEEDGWDTNNKGYRFRPLRAKGLFFSAVKYGNQKLVIVISGPFERGFRFAVDMPPCIQGRFRVAITWTGTTVTLYLNGKVAATKDKESPWLILDRPFFTSPTDSAAKALELAIAFDESSGVLLEQLATVGDIHPNPAMCVPFIVVESFSMELYLKSLIKMDGKKDLRIHSLDALFLALEKATQREIEAAYDQLSVDIVDNKRTQRLPFEEAIRIVSRAFEQWRYLNEFDAEILQYQSHPLKQAIVSVARDRYPALFGDREQR